MIKHIPFMSGLLLSAALIGCTATPEKPSENASSSAAKAATPTGKYPVHDRLEYMLHCIRNHGAKVEVTEACGCKIDEISKKMSFADFELAKTFSQLSKQNGDAGSAFRNPEQSKELKKRLKEAEDAAEQTCFGKKD